VVNVDIYSGYGADLNRGIAALEYLLEHNHIQLESRLITDVYEVNKAELLKSDLAAKLADYFAQNEHKEVKRIATLVRFFELDKCLNRNLSRYFDDQQAPEHCGHCSVCQGQVAKLAYSKPIDIPQKSTVAEAMQNLQTHLANKVDIELTESIYCRFLTAMTMPLFSRLKIRQVTGFGSCEDCRYGDVKEVVSSLLASN
jgi:ATP-dependent DNA helicase RecQ